MYIYIYKGHRPVALRAGDLANIVTSTVGSRDSDFATVHTCVWT